MTNSDIRDKLEKNVERYRRFITDQNSGDEYHTSELVDEIEALVLSLVTEAEQKTQKRMNDLWATLMIDEVGSEKAFAYKEAIEHQLTKEANSL